ncbi:MAG: pimeloyl-ACP methyl ester carboxylesterase [Phenylobacterium sp.]|jgi:pimeloyl-ACP methyl ester carboxylesterase
MTKLLTCLPGLMCDHRLWQSTWPRLAAELTPTHHQFAAADNIQAMAADVHHQITPHPDQPNQQGINLLGFSMGGYVALHYALNQALNQALNDALNNANTIKKLIIIAASAKGLNDEEKKQRSQILKYLQNNRYNGINKQRIGQFVHPSHINDPVSDIIRDMDHSLGQHTLVNQLKANIDRPPLTEQLHQLNIPVLIVGGAQDQMVKPQTLIDMGEQLPNATVSIIEHCGHMVPLEAPQQLATLINDFI